MKMPKLDFFYSLVRLRSFLILGDNCNMANQEQSLVFISYRRRDSSAASHWLSETIHAVFGLSSIFIDTDAIRMGDDWPEQINKALQSAAVLIVVIGPNWLRLTDEYGRRQLD